MYLATARMVFVTIAVRTSADLAGQSHEMQNHAGGSSGRGLARAGSDGGPGSGMRQGVQRQFSGLYGPLLSLRSIVKPSGRSPMSARKFSKLPPALEFQRSQTVMPRPP